MNALNTKLLRDLIAMKGQSLAISAVVACGIAVFVMSMTTLRSLSNAKDNYYAGSRFAEIFTALVRAPAQVAARAAMIDGVASVDHRVVEHLTLDMPGMAEPATGEAVSLPEHPSTGLNQIHLLSGRHPEATRAGEVIVSEPFAEAHQINLGQKLKATLRGQHQNLTVVGIALSPEYLIQIEPGSLFPDHQRFGVFWMSRKQLAAAADMEGSFNNLILTLARGANEKEVIRKLDELLKPYGGTGTISRHNHLSARFIEDELQGLKTMGMIPPFIFLAVAAFLLNISLRRILTRQREQIAALKAFGYTNAEISWHFCKLTSTIVLIGSVTGCLLGTWMASGMISMDQAVYRFPVIELSTGMAIYLIAMAIGAGIRGTVKLPPAEAMRPAPPANYKPSLIERLGLGRFLSRPARMVTREIGRHPVKSFFTSLGIAFACAILIVGNFGKDSIEYLIDFQYGTAERDDARVQFFETMPARAVRELEQVNGVIKAEPFRHVAARLRHGQRSKHLGITGISLKKVTIKSFMDTFAENLLRMRLFNILFAVIIAVGVVYSSARIAFSERSRDLATLRVIGLTKGEVSGILLSELALVTLFAIPMGLLIGRGLCLLMAKALETELYRIPFLIHPATYGYSAIIICSAIVSGLIVQRKIDQLDMVTALKTSE